MYNIMNMEMDKEMFNLSTYRSQNFFRVSAEVGKFDWSSTEFPTAVRNRHTTGTLDL